MIHKSISFMSNRFVIVLLLGSIVLLAVSQYNQWQERQKITRQIESLQAEARAVDDKNKQLENSLGYLSSTGATERLAREQLGLKKEGEIAVVFVPSEDNGQTGNVDTTIPNWKLWWEYFFKHREG